jgi:flagellar hook-associated protein 2
VTSSIDGLVSGLQTSSMITQLMQVEAQPQTNLKNKVSVAQTAVASYMSVNTKLNAMKAAADDVWGLPTWRSIKATSSSASVTATTSGGTNTATGTTTFDVVSLAAAQVSTARVATSGAITSNNTVSITVGGKQTDIDISATDKSAKAIADAINYQNLGVKAALVTTGGATNVLQLTGTKTGAANSFTVTGLEDMANPLTVVKTPADAVLQVGGADQDGGFAVTNDTNTFTGLMAGVTLTVSKVEQGVTVTSAADVSGTAAKFQALVDAANGTLTEVANQTAYDASTKQGSPLTGDFMVRQLSQVILGQVSGGLSWDNPDFDVNLAEDPVTNPKTIAYGSLAKLGIQLNSSGTLTFNAETFTSAYNKDPSTVQKAGIQLGTQFKAMATNQSRSVSAVITGRNSEIDSMNDQISDWDVRLATKREAMQKQYADLETALGKLKDQSSWLSSQIAGLS